MTIARASSAAAAALLLSAPMASRAVPPANDAFADAIAVAGLPFFASVDITDATLEPGEPQFCTSSSRTVWWRFTPSASGVVRFQATIDGSIGTGISVYTGASLASLSLVGCASFPGSLGLAVEANTTYYVQAGAFFGATLALSIEAVPPPPNDDFSSATPVSGLPFQGAVDATGATRQAGEPVPTCGTSTSGTVWYRFTPDSTGSITATADAPFPRLVAAYTGSSIEALTQRACSAGLGQATLIATAGTTYWFQVSGLFDFTGPLTFRLERTPPPVASFIFFPGDPSAFDTVQFIDTSFDPVFAGFLPSAWAFGDGATATGPSTTHRYASDGDYLAGLVVTTVDGRTASTSQTVRVRTHDVAVTRLSAPLAASVGQTRSLAVDVRNTRYPEVVEVQLFRSTVTGYQLVGTLRQSLPVRTSTRTTRFAFSYTFSADDAALGSVTFRAVATLVGARDALPLDNEAISTPATRVK